MSKAKWIITDYDTAEMIVWLLNKYEWKKSIKTELCVIIIWRRENKY